MRLAISSDSGMPFARPVESSTTMVSRPSREVLSKISTGPSLPTEAVD
jgi:hypothetical protein